MAKLMVTEALAEIKTIGKRLEKKREHVKSFLFRQDVFKDPFQGEGGSFHTIERERRGIADLERRVVAIRQAIADVNRATDIAVGGETRSIAEWLIWRRDVAPGAQKFLIEMRNSLANIRAEAQKKGYAVTVQADVTRPQDIVVNVNEAKLAEEIESFEQMLGSLDGALSLKNATIAVEV